MSRYYPDANILVVELDGGSIMGLSVVWGI